MTMLMKQKLFSHTLWRFIMSTSKTFSVAGVSTLDGKTKIRFANDALRIKILGKNGHTDVQLKDLPHEMTKAEIAQYLFDIGFGADNPAVVAAIQDLAKKNKVKLTSSTTETATTADTAVTA
jgi:hypothetical protein